MVYLDDLFSLSCRSVVVPIQSKVPELVLGDAGAMILIKVGYWSDTALSQLDTLVITDRDCSIIDWRCMVVGKIIEIAGRFFSRDYDRSYASGQDRSVTMIARPAS